MDGALDAWDMMLMANSPSAARNKDLTLKQFRGWRTKWQKQSARAKFHAAVKAIKEMEG